MEIELISRLSTINYESLKMNDTILHIHNAAMDLVDLAKLKKAKGGDNSVYDTYLKAAYELELYAANKFSDLKSDNDFLWESIFIAKCWLVIGKMWLLSAGS